jgi:hypothetical protein
VDWPSGDEICNDLEIAQSYASQGQDVIPNLGWVFSLDAPAMQYAIYPAL